MPDHPIFPFTLSVSPSTASNLGSAARPHGYPEFHCLNGASLVALIRPQSIHFMALVC